MATANGEKTGGRQKGTPNKENKAIRDMFTKLVEDNLESVQVDLDLMKPVDRVKALIDLSKFCLPTLKAIDYVDKSPVKKTPIQIVFTKK